MRLRPSHVREPIPNAVGAGSGPPSRRRAARAPMAVVLTGLALLALPACWTVPGGGPGGPPPDIAADLSQELTGGNGPFIGAAVTVDLAQAGYVEHEYAAAGTASSYRAVGGLPQDGRWTFEPDGSASYRTRVLVRRPAQAAEFSGTVIVEWLNVSGGVDADPEWANLHEEITRQGHVWVGVSAQQIGVIGGQVLVQAPGPGSELAGKGLKAIDPARYGSLAHPGDGFSTDQTAPVFDVQTESDLTGILNSSKARQPDSDRFRLWEVAGTAHADAHLLGANAASIDCGVPINNGPLHLVAKAALQGLTDWLETGRAPVTGPRVELAEGLLPGVRRDADGIALGGVRTPPVDVPIDVLSGDPGPKLSTICLLLGSTTPLPADRVAELYPTRAAYQQRYGTSADKTVEAGFVLREDRAALLDFAEPERVTG
ncbi:conserved hypothetical protein [Frankia sp. Hr75.2]|nr:conserved hypothetical protein [Frankia sp. Hr75.2]